ncbi:MAG TPA: OmpA family protein [Pyrinomonadaceae bacterium]|jgi:outer membrane protein OmpA-like peptidoglycan-associated protein
MNHPAYTFTAARMFSAGLLLMLAATVSLVCAQGDVPRQSVAVTYPLDQTVNVKFRGTTRLPRLKGEAKVRRAGRRGTRVELSIENLPRASELGGVYTTYVLWAISPEGRVDNLGEIKRSGSMIIDSKLDVTTPLQSFALIVTAEPHFLVRGPSRMVVLENLPPQNANGADVATINVQYVGNSSDYFNDPRVPEVADSDYRKTPTSLLGARQAINLARYAGAEREASDELREAQAQLEEAENAWRLKQSEAEVDAIARRAVSLGARAEEMAETRRAARQRRDEIARRDAAVREAEQTAANAGQEIADLRSALAREQHARELAERDAANATQQLRDLRSEVARLRDEINTVRAEGEDAKVKLARIEGERQALAARQAEEQRIAQQRSTAATLKQTLSRFGTVRETASGLVLVLPESVWANARASELAPAANAKLEPLAALLANNPDYQVIIQSYTDNRGDEASLQQLTEARAQALAQHFISAGVDGMRIQANGMGVANPVAPNNKPSGRLRNRRTEITLTLNGSQNTAINQ